MRFFSTWNYLKISLQEISQLVIEAVSLNHGLWRVIYKNWKCKPPPGPLYLCIQKIKNKENRIFRSMPLRIWIGGRLWSFNYQKFSVTGQSLQHAGHRKSPVSLFKSFPSVCTLLFDGEHLRNILNNIASGVSRAKDYWEYLE